MKIRKKIANRTIYNGPNGAIDLTDQQHINLIAAAFKLHSGYPAYFSSAEIAAHLKYEVRPFDSKQPSIEIAVSDFNPYDRTVEVVLSDELAKTLEKVHSKPISEIDLLTAWLIGSTSSGFDIKVTAFYFQTPNEINTGDPDETKNKSTP